ncbi:hypothetical protein GmRootV512_30620 [Variovorax sp. V512]
MHDYKMLIDGQWLGARSGQTLDTENPYTGKLWARIPKAALEDADAAVRAAHRALKQGPWGALTATDAARSCAGWAT